MDEEDDLIYRVISAPPEKRARTREVADKQRNRAKPQWEGSPIGVVDGQTQYEAFSLDEEVFRLGDTIKIRATAREEKKLGVESWMARVVKLWEDESGEKWMQCQWFYLPDELPGGRKPGHHLYEIFPTTHADVNTLDTVNGRVTVLSWDKWHSRKASDPSLDDDGNPCFCARQLFDPTTSLLRVLPENWELLRPATGTESHLLSAPSTPVRNIPKSQRKPPNVKATRRAKLRKLRRQLTRETDDEGDKEDEGETVRRGDSTEDEEEGREGVTPSSSPFSLSTRSSPADQIARACIQLQLSNVPDPLPCRQAQRAKITRFLLNGISLGGAGKVMYIHGVPGTGKTATVMQIVRELQGRGEDFAFVAVNGVRLTHPYQLYAQLHRALTGEQLPATRALQKLEDRFSPSKTAAKKKTKNGSKTKTNTPAGGGGGGRGGGNRPVVLLVDEIDFLVTRKQSVLYNLFDWPTREGSNLIVLTISNQMNLPERLLPRIKSRGGFDREAFQPYTRREIEKIVKNRLEGTDVFSTDAIDMAARKGAGTSGDIRRALQLCRRAAELAHESIRDDGSAAAGEEEEEGGGGGGGGQLEVTSEGSSPLVTVRHIQRASYELTVSHTERAIQGSSLWEKLFLLAVAREEQQRRDGKAVGKISLDTDASRQFFVLLRQHRLGTGGAQPSKREVLEMSNRLAELRLVELEWAPGERWPTIRFLGQCEEVMHAVLEDAEVGSVVSDVARRWLGEMEGAGGV